MKVVLGDYESYRPIYSIEVHVVYGGEKRPEWVGRFLSLLGDLLYEISINVYGRKIRFSAKDINNKTKFLIRAESTKLRERLADAIKTVFLRLHFPLKLAGTLYAILLMASGKEDILKRIKKEIVESAKRAYKKNNIRQLTQDLLILCMEVEEVKLINSGVYLSIQNNESGINEEYYSVEREQSLEITEWRTLETKGYLSVKFDNNWNIRNAKFKINDYIWCNIEPFIGWWYLECDLLYLEGNFYNLRKSPSDFILQNYYTRSEDSISFNVTRAYFVNFKTELKKHDKEFLIKSLLQTPCDAWIWILMRYVNIKPCCSEFALSSEDRTMLKLTTWETSDSAGPPAITFQSDVLKEMHPYDLYQIYDFFLEVEKGERNLKDVAERIKNISW